MALDDAPIQALQTSLGGGEYLPLVLASGKEKPTKINAILGILPADVTMAAGAAAVVSTRLTVFSGRTATTAATIPAATGDLRELVIQNANTSSGAVTVTAPTASIYAAGSASASATDVIAIATCARYWSDGTSWYRVTT